MGFHFNKKVAAGTSARVKVNQPSLSICDARGLSGSITDNTNQVAVQCEPSWGISGTTDGVVRTGMVLGMNGQTLEIQPGTTPTKIPFTFPGRVKNGTNYKVTVLHLPNGQQCNSVKHGDGIATKDVSDVYVSCVL